MGASGSSYMHGAGLEILRGERQKKLQDQIIAAETTADSLDNDMAQIKQKVWIHRKGSCYYNILLHVHVQ